jgi:hypothetical protein
VDPRVQQMVIYGAVALVVLGVGIFFLARR